MNSKVHPLVVILVILLTILSIGIWTWGSGEAKKIGGPAGLRIDPRGHLFIQIRNRFLEHDTNGEFLTQHDLGQLGIENVLGAIAFFSDGDVLVRRGPDPSTFGDNVRAYQRKTNQQSIAPLTPDTGLYRCSLEDHSCRVFGNEPIDFKATHGLFIDWNTDDVYISDTTRHLLRKYSSSGEPLAEPAAGFKFPNQLVLHEGQLFVADTNHHRIRVVDPADDAFGEELDAIDVIPEIASISNQTWPTHIARIDDQWWVNNMRSAMNEGGIYIFDNDWQFRRKVELPAGADPISISPFRDGVLVSDWNNNRIYQVSKSGVVLVDFTSAGFEEILAESGQARLQYEMYSYGGIAIFILTIVGLMVRGMASTLSGEGSKARTIRPVPSNALSNQIEWFEPDPVAVRKIETGLRIAIAVLILIDLVFAAVVVYYASLQLGLQLLLPAAFMTLIFIPIARLSRANMDTAIGVTCRELTLRDHKGRESTCPMKDVQYNDIAITTNDMAALFGKPQMPIYDPETLRSELFPKLEGAQRVSMWAMQKRLHRIKHPNGVKGILLVIFSLLVTFAMLALFATMQ
jgi:hypothetical protein